MQKHLAEVSKPTLDGLVVEDEGVTPERLQAVLAELLSAETRLAKRTQAMHETLGQVKILRTRFELMRAQWIRRDCMM